MDEEEIPIEVEEQPAAKSPKKDPDYYDDPDDYAAAPEELDYEPTSNSINSSTS